MPDMRATVQADALTHTVSTGRQRHRVPSLAHQIGRPVHGAEVHTSEVLADDSKRKKLRPGEDREIEARNAKPGTALPLIRKLPPTTVRIATPNTTRANPIKLEICSGNVLNPVIKLIA